MAGYVVAIARIDKMTDGLKEYIGKAADLSAEHGAEYVVRGPAKEVLEGDYLNGRSVVVSKFETLEKAESYYHSDAYQKDIKPLREGSGVYDVAIFEGP
ncbi:MAG: DUF1330 domain-containing protein [Rhodospirillaceae bacterium]|jgi:uncharacterized protein (DUF1330 family)|nr:DUF1330 domain-containing protein [Rhodospirillaceae bacterium]MBT5241655.1 DUF1330 domain-containing protein [Rhodospirillaceae bacterium]